jgi:hypothetical protein
VTCHWTFLLVPVAHHWAELVGILELTMFIELALTLRVVFAAKYIKKLELYLLNVLSLPSIKAFAGTSVLEPRTGLLDLKALTDVLPTCACRSLKPGPTAGSLYHRCRTQEAVRPEKRPQNARNLCIIAREMFTLLTLCYSLYLQ